MTLVSGRSTIVALLALVAASCQSQDNKPQPTFVSNDRALRTAAMPARAAASTQAQQHFIEFRSRYALTYGHSYVIFGRLNRAGRMVNPEVAGLAPKSDDPNVYVLGHLAPVPASTGWTDGDLEDAYRSASWRVLLTEAEYRKVVASIRKLQASSPLWHASLYNCNAFVADIARSMGYKTPGTWLRPQQFITKLREMNGG
ncbi:MAG: hypothetical protein E5W49_01105 [Mesorhizobium sp.]|uniref:hypothetical protein n=1 Tax=Mesorhizobium sp. TaxID=1871066 RepID=UPI000FE6E349|nr:hypothetical protein [Mesorhizobium sp.]RWE70867.1 MAG: hypothetical protein EOS62_00505 [Mesorhizobium sp.]TIU24259.1 MAG: hypothetical protein E5W49_01105 [Mesorhizobium sp.]TIV12146.1 MAG: hypothetical protein E5W00_00520 [Mesorhizobium sp.]TIX05781.1 MAG: hypothetical protein E5V57_08970 [Mesorhizobium sp.]